MSRQIEMELDRASEEYAREYCSRALGIFHVFGCERREYVHEEKRWYGARRIRYYYGAPNYLFAKAVKFRMRHFHEVKGLGMNDETVRWVWEAVKRRGYPLCYEFYHSAYRYPKTKEVVELNRLYWKAKWLLTYKGKKRGRKIPEGRKGGARWVVKELREEVMVLERWGLCEDLVLLVRTWAGSHYGPEWFRAERWARGST